ncbi:MAG: aspartyl protease family protein [Treponema sp.]|nr:aspartyl protease family protein [Treponema sp.]
MGLVHTEITLKNRNDMMKAEENLIPNNKIRQLTVNALVDTGAWTMVINEETRAKLGLERTRTKTGTLADGSKAVYDVVGPLEIIWKNRGVLCEAMVIPNAEINLLGAIPLEAMDLMIHPSSQEVIGAHGDEVIVSVR